jgi:hypothetical protein
MREDILVIVNPSGGAERDGGDDRAGGAPAETCRVKYRVGFNAALLAEIALVRRLPPTRKELSHQSVSLWT